MALPVTSAAGQADVVAAAFGQYALSPAPAQPAYAWPRRPPRRREKEKRQMLPAAPASAAVIHRAADAKAVKQHSSQHSCADGAYRHAAQQRAEVPDRCHSESEPRPKCHHAQPQNAS